VSDPRRLTDDPEVSASIREALAGERSSNGFLDLDAGWKKLHAAASGLSASAAIAGESPAAAPTSVVAVAPKDDVESGRDTSRWIRWGIGTATGVGLAWLLVVTSAPGDAPPARPAVVVAPPAPTVPSAISAPTADPAITDPPAVSVKDLPKAVAAPVSKARVGAVPPVTAMVDDNALREELAQIAKIRSLVDRDPTTALALAEDGQRRFANGHLVEEREGLRIIALARLGRRDEARTKAAMFMNRYPKSALVDRIKSELHLAP
jgi:hypothetical protein